MVNDNTPTKMPIAERFAAALEHLMVMCEDAGMHPHEAIGPLKRWLVWARQQSMPHVEDEASLAKGGFPPVDDAGLRRVLQLEDYEPLPPRSTER